MDIASTILTHSCPMFNETLTLSDGTANHAYSTVVTGDYSRVRRVPSTDLDKPELLTISHTMNEKTNVSRSLVKTEQVLESAEGVKGTIRIYTVVEIPRDVALVADVTKVHNQHHAFMGTSGYLEKLANLES